MISQSHPGPSVGIGSAFGTQILSMKVLFVGNKRNKTKLSDHNKCFINFPFYAFFLLNVTVNILCTVLLPNKIFILNSKFGVVTEWKLEGKVRKNSF